MPRLKRIAVLVSGGGTNLGALIKARDNDMLGNGELALTLSSNENAYALERAADAGIKSAVLPRERFDSPEQYGDAISDALNSESIDLVVLAGFMCILGGRLLSEYKNRIINVHPALIPSFCGEGYYGLKVHEAALRKGVKISGATVHFVDDEVDGGPIILQAATEVLPDDTPESLQLRVMEKCEQVILPRAVRLFCDGRIRLDGRRVIILPGQ